MDEEFRRDVERLGERVEELEAACMQLGYQIEVIRRFLVEQFGGLAEAAGSMFDPKPINVGGVEFKPLPDSVGPGGESVRVR